MFGGNGDLGVSTVSFKIGMVSPWSQWQEAYAAAQMNRRNALRQLCVPYAMNSRSHRRVSGSRAFLFDPAPSKRSWSQESNRCRRLSIKSPSCVGQAEDCKEGIMPGRTVSYIILWCTVACQKPPRQGQSLSRDTVNSDLRACCGLIEFSQPAESSEVLDTAPKSLPKQWIDSYCRTYGWGKLKRLNLALDTLADALPALQSQPCKLVNLRPLYCT